jgi:hypothetical protein
MAAYEAVGETLRLLRGDDAAWAYARPKLVALLDGADTDSVRAGLLKIVLFDSGNGGPRAAARTLAAHPEAFDTNLLVKAYERGVEAAAPLLEKRCHYDPDRMIDVAPAASLALQGNEAGRRVLEAVFETPILVRTRPDTWFAAAIGLRALGEKDAWTRAAAAAETEVRQRLDGGDVRAAASYVLTMEYYHGAILHDHAVSLAFMCRPADRHVQEHLDDLTTGEAVWARFREVQR